MLLYLILIWNIIVFFIYGYDKWQAKRNGRRVSEKCLLFTALLAGGIGALIGMELFRHKTKHLKFKLIVPIECIITFALIIYIFYNHI